MASPIFSEFAADHGLINYIETKAKGCHLKKIYLKRDFEAGVYKSLYTGDTFHYTVCWYF
jgi:hypothetical protein